MKRNRSGISKRLDKLFYFLENHLIFIIIALLFLYFIICEVIFLISSYEVICYISFQTSISRAMLSMQNSLLSIAAIFIGVYVTVYTLLGSINSDSIFAHLNEKNFKRLITFIKNAFIASFSYLIVVMAFELFYEDYSNIPFFMTFASFLIVVYMFLTAIRLGVILYVSFEKDLKNLPKSIKEHKEELKKEKEMKLRLGKFLESIEEKESLKRAKLMSDRIDKKK